MLTEITIYLVMVMVLLWVGILLSWGRRWFVPLSAQNLFLAVPVKMKGGVEQVCYLRWLSTSSAELVSTSPFAKQDRFTIFMDSLPGYGAAHGRPVQAIVKDCQKLQGFPTSYKVRVQFTLNDATYRIPLARYISQLNGDKARRYA